MDGVPLPSALSGVTVERTVRLDSALLYFVNGALSWLADCESLEETGTLTEEVAREALQQMLSDYYTLEPIGTPMIAVGSVVPSAAASMPAGYLLCNGSSYNRVDWPDLYAVLPAGLKTGADTFITPDLRGKFILGVSATHAQLTTGGAENVTLTADEMPLHFHTMNQVTPTSPAHGHTQAAHAHTVTSHNHPLTAESIPVRETASAFVSGTGLLQKGSATTVNSSVAVTTAANTGMNAPGMDLQTPAINNGTAIINPFTPTMQSAGGGSNHQNMPPFYSLSYYVYAGAAGE